MMKRFLLQNFLLLVVLLYGCQGGEISLNEDDERFAALYADFLLVQADYERIKGSGGAFSKIDSLQKVFSFHRISSEQFSSQFRQYKDDPARWLKVQERALSMLGKRRELSNQETRPPTSSFNPKSGE